MKKILFPTEFSEHAPNVFTYAVELAYFLKSNLIMMHAFNQPEVRLMQKEDLEKMAEEANAKLMKFVKDNLPELYKEVKIDYIVRSGLASDEILNVALEEEAELIVMGRTGLTDSIETMFGSTTMQILAKADCPLLIIPSTAKPDGIDTIVFTTNFEFRDLNGINFLRKWSGTFDADIHCLHVIEHEKHSMAALKDMSILKKTYSKNKRMYFDLVKGEFETEIERYAKRKQPDIVAMMSHKRNFITRLLEKSTAKEVARRTEFPLLVLKDNAYEPESFASDWLKLVQSIA